jgi:hypothetical protein
MGDDKTKPVLLVKKSDSKKASLWNSLANNRIIKQHGGFDIPEGDLHAIPKYSSPIDDQKASPAETKEALTELEKEINKLKEKNSQTPLNTAINRLEHTNPEASQDIQNRKDDTY